MAISDNLSKTNLFNVRGNVREDIEERGKSFLLKIVLMTSLCVSLQLMPPRHLSVPLLL